MVLSGSKIDVNLTEVWQKTATNIGIQDMLLTSMLNFLKKVYETLNN